MKLDIRKMISDPFWFAMYMLLIAYLGAPAFLKIHLGVFRKAGLVWGAVLLAIFLIKNYRAYLENKFALVLFLFCVANGITILVNWRTKLSSNIFTFGYMTTSLLLVFNMYWQKEEEEVEKKIRIFSWMNVIMPLIYASIALITFLLSIQVCYELPNGYQYLGMFENRLWGLFNPNTGGMMAVISMAFSLYLLNKSVQKKKLLIANIVIQYLYLILTQSRSAYGAFVFFILIVIGFVWVKRENLFTKDRKTCIKSLLKTVIIFVCVLALSPIVKHTIVLIPDAVNSFKGEEEKTEIVRTEEFFEEEDVNSVSNGRVEIWKAGLRVWKNSPVFGAGANCIYEYAKRDLDKGTAQALHNGGLHNVYVTTLVASGVVGLGILAVFLIMVFIRFARALFTKTDPSTFILMGLCGGILLSDFMESRILYANSSVHYIFWMTMAYLCCKINDIRKKQA